MLATAEIWYSFLTFAGHTFCFLCVRSVVGDKRRDQVPACPTCQKPISMAPSAPSKLIEELVRIIKTTEESQNQHRIRLVDVNLQVEEIYKLCKPEDPWCQIKQQKPSYDLYDGVYRCPVSGCGWEVNRDGSCSRDGCKYNYAWGQSEAAGAKSKMSDANSGSDDDSISVESLFIDSDNLPQAKSSWRARITICRQEKKGRKKPAIWPRRR